MAGVFRYKAAASSLAALQDLYASPLQEQQEHCSIHTSAKEG